MASAQSRKRASADDLSHSPNKKIQSGPKRDQPSKNTVEHFYCRYWPPQVWDNLSRVPLARIALRELDRRNSAPRPAPVPAARTADLAWFARHGGPDLRHLRGYPEPEDAVHTMASLSGRPTAPIRKTSAYNPAFEQLMIDHSIYPLRCRVPNNLNATTPQPNNLAEERKLLLKRRPSLDSFTETDFEDFQQKNDAANTETTVYQTVVPLITGSSDSPSWANNLFSNLEDIAEEVVKPKPDFFDGAHRMAIHEKIRSANEDGNLNLNKLIIPTNNVRTPVLPNFFMELKGPESNARIAQRQVMHVGAVGARGMHAIQNWGKEEPSYDGNAYTFSSTYHDGLLSIYVHHVAPPTAPGGRPQYYITLVKSFCLTNDIDTWRQGVTAFRNARDRARWHRDNFIQAANARAGQSDGAAAAPPEAGTGTTAAAGVADVVVDGEPAHISTAASSRA